MSDTKVSKSKNSCLEPLKQGFSGLNHPNNQSAKQTLDTIKLYSGFVNRFRLEYGLNYPAIEVMQVIFFHYHETGLRITANQVFKKIGFGTWVGVRARIEVLNQRGLLDVTYNKCAKYEPSYKMLEVYKSLGIEINDIFSQTA